ncbi:heterokaryon incompatibility protein-domain-containing protein [Xylaria castorea]|nr:heterokaryon incompatibility protein-domain-containing protein [Xylaria castorea]
MSKPPLRFTYEALSPGQIRLLYSAVHEDMLVWTLKAVQLHNEGSQAPIAFDALSYTWGDQSHTFPFICNDQELRIHRNLRDALPYLARRQSSLPIWVDAVCIDQLNHTEKFAQIRMMHSIYRQATQIWAWLGCGTEYSGDAIRLLPEVGRFGKELEMHYRRKSDKRFTPHSTILPYASSPIWKAIRELIYNEWFNRLWVVQEAALAKCIRVLYEDEEIDWDILKKAVDHGWNIHEDINKQPIFGSSLINDTVFYVREVVQTSDDKTPWSNHLLNILRLTTDMSQCSEPRDRVFGHFGFLTQDQLQQLGLDDSMPIEELYMRLTHFLLSNGSQSYQNWWDILQFATATDKMPGLPSWCPDYHSWSQRPFNIRSTEEPVYLNGWVTNYRASRATSSPQQSTNFRELKVRGKIFDLVKRRYPVIPNIAALVNETGSAEELRNLYLVFRDWERTIATDVLGPASSNLPDDPTSGLGFHEKRRFGVTVDNYWRTLVGNITKSGKHTFTYETFRSFRSTLDQCLLLGLEKIGSGPWADLGPGTPVHELLKAMLSTLGGRRLFCTVKGGFGFGSKWMEVNDQVCVLNNANTTHLLRRSTKTKRRKTFRIVGDAYFDGMMNGQIELLGLEEQDIVLV